MAASAITYQRTREMTIDELLLENRIVFMVGEINQASAARTRPSRPSSVARSAVSVRQPAVAGPTNPSDRRSVASTR